MSSQYYMQIWHDIIGKYLYEAIRKKKDPECKLNTRVINLSNNIMELNIDGVLLLKQL